LNHDQLRRDAALDVVEANMAHLADLRRAVDAVAPTSWGEVLAISARIKRDQVREARDG